MHIHSNYSDGSLRVEEIVDYSVKKGLEGISISDHDTVSGLNHAIEYAKIYKDFLIIPGIELSSFYEGEEVHILGYFIDYEDPGFQDFLKEIFYDRRVRGLKMLEKLENLGLKLDPLRKSDLIGSSYIGRPDIAQLLVYSGYSSSVDDAFRVYLGLNKPGYVGRAYRSPREITNMIKGVGGISILAHPGLIKTKIDIDDIIGMGLDGVECYHPSHNKNQCKYYKSICMDNNLIITGGSDCHGLNKIDKITIGDYFIDVEDLSYFGR